MARSGARERPRSKGSLHDGTTVDNQSSATAVGIGGEPRSAENAQRRIRSAENQHRMVSTGPREALPLNASGPITVAPSGPAPDSYLVDDDLEEDAMQAVASTPAAAVLTGIEDAFPQDFHRELKRPLSRKKDPSASAAAGLGAFSGPARMTDAFEQRKTRQPIPVESWGPRPPSRAGLPQKAAPLDEGLADVDPKILLGQTRGRGEVGGASSSNGRPAGKAAGDQALGVKVVGGTWAAARAEPRVLSETRNNRGRDRRAGTRNSPEVTYPMELGVFGCGTGAPSQRLSKSLSGVFDHHNTPFRDQKGTASWTGSPSSWASHHVDAAGTLEVSGYGLGDTTAPWPGSPADSCGGGSPPTRKGRHAVPDGVSVEDVEADDQGRHASYGGRDAASPQVIVTRSSQNGKARSTIRRGSDQRPRGEQSMPFNTSLDVDFLSLFAS